jgi:hypothetical protein
MLSFAMGTRIMLGLVLHSVIMGVGIVPSVVLLSVTMISVVGLVIMPSVLRTVVMGRVLC